MSIRHFTFALTWLRLRSELFLVMQEGLKTQHSTSLNHWSHTHIVTGSESYLWSFQCVTWCTRSQSNLTTPSRSLALSGSCRSCQSSIHPWNDRTEHHYGEWPTHQEHSKSPGAPGNLTEKAASPTQNAVVQFYVQAQPKPWEELSLI